MFDQMTRQLVDKQVTRAGSASTRRVGHGSGREDHEQAHAEHGGRTKG